MYDDCPMSQFRYRMVTVGVDRLAETLNSLGEAGWRLVTATPAGDVWSALLEQRLDSPRQRTAPPRARVEVRIGGETVEKVADADGLSAMDGVVYLRCGDEVLATYAVDDLVAVDWSPTPSYARVLERKRRDHPRHGEPWSPSEDDQLRQEHEAHWTVQEMIDAPQRGRGAIESRLAKLGLDRSEAPASPGQYPAGNRLHRRVAVFLSCVDIERYAETGPERTLWRGAQVA
ncbi:conserved hypothetical protein [Parafrankia sp. Ea1.12]|nr:conserved hypothetical protein [Parafrankia sp. Ea1.12]